MSLQEEIDQRAKQIHTDSYSMSIGELMSLYERKEIDIHPEFQRMFRWSQLQKTKLIESILLGIPIPPIFVSQSDNGVWDVIDGLQRISTILEFTGLLEKEDGSKYAQLVLSETDYLESLKNKKWEDENDEANSFTASQRLAIKRAKFAVNIIKKESDSGMKYELFQRLNTLGSSLSDQELRNCLLLMANRDFALWINQLAEKDDFKNAASLSERLIEEQYDRELVVRFLIFKNETELSFNDVGDFLNRKSLANANRKDFDYKSEEDVFDKTFSIIFRALGEDAFKKYNHVQQKYTGPFLISAFEVIAIGIGSNIELILEMDDADQIVFVNEKSKSIWTMSSFTENIGGGISASRRMPKTIPLGKALFKP